MVPIMEIGFPLEKDRASGSLAAHTGPVSLRAQTGRTAPGSHADLAVSSAAETEANRQCGMAFLRFHVSTVVSGMPSAREAFADPPSASII